MISDFTFLKVQLLSAVQGGVPVICRLTGRMGDKQNEWTKVETKILSFPLSAATGSDASVRSPWSLWSYSTAWLT